MKRVIFRQNEANRGRLIQAAAIFFLALAARLAAAFVLGDLPISRTPQLDSAAYVSWARALAADPAFWPAYPEHAPGYPMFMAAILGVSGGSLMAVRIAQAILGAIGCVLTARVAARTLTPGAFLPAGLLQAAYAPLVYIDSALLAESLLIFLLILSLDLATGDGEFYRLKKELDFAALARAPLALEAFVERIAISAPEGEPLRLEFESFLAAVQGRGPVAVSGRAGRDALDVALRIQSEIERTLGAAAHIGAASA